jgi:hypothetical protein
MQDLLFLWFLAPVCRIILTNARFPLDFSETGITNQGFGQKVMSLRNPRTALPVGVQGVYAAKAA